MTVRKEIEKYVAQLTRLSASDLERVQKHLPDCPCFTCGRYFQYKIVRDIIEAWEYSKPVEGSIADHT